VQSVNILKGKHTYIYSARSTDFLFYLDGLKVEPLEAAAMSADIADLSACRASTSYEGNNHIYIRETYEYIQGGLCYRAECTGFVVEDGLEL